MQRATRATIASSAVFAGTGLHSGRETRAAVLPARPGQGISFVRVDLPGRPSVPARWDMAGPLTLQTTLVRGDASVSTVEHLMAALAAAGVDDALVEVDGPELPILDGSSRPFLQGLLRAGIRASSVPRRAIRVTRPVEVRDGASSARLEPHEGFALDCGIEFENPAIGRGRYRGEIDLRSFSAELAAARTFVLEDDVAALRAAGLALGGSLDNAVVVGGRGVLNPGGLRMAGEFARHKALDAVGDLFLAGAPVLGRYVSRRAGHRLNNALVAVLMASPSSWRWTQASASDGLDAPLLKAAA